MGVAVRRDGGMVGGVRWKNRKRSGRVLFKVFGIDVGICYLDPLVRAKWIHHYWQISLV